MDREDLVRVARDWRLGRDDGYPACCVAHYCWDSLWRWPSGSTRTYQVRTRLELEPDWVVCGLVHAGGSPYRLPRRAAEILRWQWLHLRPTPAGSRLRAAMRETRTARRFEPEELRRWCRDEEMVVRRYWDDGGLNPDLR
jgi:hypothetical protein